MKDLASKLAYLFGPGLAKALFPKVTASLREQTIYAFVTQTGTDAPTATYQRNDTGVELTFTYDSVGVYLITHPLIDASIDCHHYIAQGDSSVPNAYNYTSHRNNNIILASFDSPGGTNADDILFHTPLKLTFFT